MSAEKPKTAIAQKQSEITTNVMKRVNLFQKSGELKLPENYSPENALKQAQLLLVDMVDRNKKPVLQSCTKTSIANALLKTVVWGLSPQKGQVYFIPYADKLECSVSYTGNIAIAKRYGNLKRIKANCIMEEDVFEFAIDNETGRRKITKHEQTLESLDSKKMKGAYAVYELNDGTTDVEIMSMTQIENSWKQGSGYGKSNVHDKFKDQMAQKTVLNRACKLLTRTSDDSILFNDEDKNIDHAKENANYEIAENANQEEINVDDYEDADYEEEESGNTPADQEQKTESKPEPNNKEQDKEPEQKQNSKGKPQPPKGFEDVYKGGSDQKSQKPKEEKGKNDQGKMF